MLAAPFVTNAWRNGTCGTTSWTPDEHDCVCDDKGSIRLASKALLSWHELVAECTAECHKCSRCNFVSVSRKWKDCSWFSSCGELEFDGAAGSFRTYQVSSIVHNDPPKARCEKACGFHRDCRRQYTAVDVERSAALWDPMNLEHGAELQKRASEMAAACQGTHRTRGLAFGGWCLGRDEKEWNKGVVRRLPLEHIPADAGLVQVLLSRVLPTKSGGWFTLNDFGAGVGQIGRELVAKEPGVRYRGYDGAGNVVERTGGFVKFFDLTMPLSLPRSDWLLSIEVGEHVPHEHEMTVVRNFHAHNRCGIILSWGALDQMGHNHVNNHDPAYVRTLFNELGYEVDAELMAAFKWRVQPWLRKNLFAFRRRDAPALCRG